MGSVVFEPRALPDNMAEVAGFKVGLAMSLEEICDRLSGTGFQDIVRDGETAQLSLRSEAYEELYYNLLHRIGYTNELYQGDFAEMLAQNRRMQASAAQYDLYLRVEHAIRHFWWVAQQTGDSNAKDPTLVLAAIKQRFGSAGAEIANESYAIMNRGVRMDPNRGVGKEWVGQLGLTELLNETTSQPEASWFIEQRYIAHLSNAQDCIGDMHWRQFEKLTQEFFERDGFQVDIGPGGDDEGLDARVWNRGAGPADRSLFMVRGKGRKDALEKLVVKGLHVDLAIASTQYGLIVTTSELAPGVKTTISARTYDRKVVEREGVRSWLKKLRSPGTGIVR